MLLHILWIILKIILVFVGTIVGLIILALLLLLFCPVRYKASAETEEGILQSRVQACASWLFHGILLEFTYEGKETKSRIRIFGIPLSWIREKIKFFSRLKRKKHLSRRKTAKPQKQGKKEEGGLCIEELPAAREKTQNSQEPQKKEDVVPKAEEETETGKVKSDLFQKIRNKIDAFLGKLKRISNVLKKLKKTVRKLEWWKLFWENPRVQEAFSLTKKETLRLLKHILPTKTRGEIEFGCEDPSVTGMILAILGITMPIHKNCVGITPVYSGENILRGKVVLKGRIYGIVILVSAIKVYFNKNVKYTISRWKRKEG